jgi:N-acetylneuraminic acid mutarotase
VDSQSVTSRRSYSKPDVRGRQSVAWVMSLVLATILAFGLVACSDSSVTTTGATDGTGPASTTVAAPALVVWTDLDPAGPLPEARSGVSMVYDTAAGNVVLFGGWDPDTDFGDTWAYDPATNTWADLGPAGALPAPRALHQMVYDSAGGEVILFGGTSDAGRYGDTWAYDPVANSWADLSAAGGPAARSAHSMVCDSDGGKVILFGGAGDAGRYDDTWVYDPAAKSWTDLRPEGSVPSGRSAHSMVYAPSSGQVILFGGYDEGLLNDTWAYDPTDNTWTDLDPAGGVPSPRGNHRMVYDSASGQVILFGGYDGNAELYDTWAYDPATNTWTDLDPIDPPPAREEHAMVYDPASGRVIIFGGLDHPADRDLDDTWALGDLED